MRPRRLRIQNFGPYKDSTIDFESLDSFFLISGPTGSGKTFIFDALMYALYGRVNGTRSGESYVSHFSEPGDSPRIELDFSIGDQTFKIIRIPEHDRPSKRGDKLVKQPQELVFGEVFDEQIEWQQGNVSSLNNSIHSVIKLSADEFSKIIILPQGEFQRFLEDSSDERAKILAKLFPTEIHQKLMDQVAVQANEGKNELDLLFKELQRIQSRLQSILMIDSESFSIELVTSKNNEITDLLNQTQTEIAVFRNELNAIDTQIKTQEQRNILLAKSCEINTKINDLIVNEAAIKTKETLLDTLKMVEPLLVSLRQINEQRKGVSIYEAELKQLRIDLKKHTDEEKIFLHTYDDKKKLMTDISKDLNQRITLQKSALEKIPRVEKLAKRIEVLQIKHQQLEDLFNKQKQRLAAAEGRVEDLRKQRSNRDRLINDLQNLQSQLHDLIKIENEVNRRDIRVTELSELRLKHKEKLQAYDLCLEAFEEIQSQFLAQKYQVYASELASRLEENSPCPVCGGLDHPSPAKPVTSTILTLEDVFKKKELELKLLKKDVESLVEGMHKIGDELEKFEKNLPDAITLQQQIQENEKKRETWETEIKASNAQVSELEDLENEIVELRNGQQQNFETRETCLLELKEKKVEHDTLALDPSFSIEDLKCSESNLAKNEAELDALLKRKQWLEQQVKILHTRIEEQENHLIQEKDKLATQETNLTKLLKQKDISSEKDLLAYEQDLTNIDKIEHDIQNYYKEKQSLKIEQKSLENQIALLPEANLNALNERSTELGTKLDRGIGEEGKLKEQITLLSAEQTNYLQVQTEIDERQQAAIKYIELNKILNGKNSKSVRFSNFVLGMYLEKITFYASQRLRIMSDNQYLLQFDDGVKHKGRQHGLDLKVFDYHTGKTRSVKSLSGGEKFITSLSLAMGLADVIQERSGGVKLESLFIDEGFGSLDEHSLDNALYILNQVRGNRMIGIISHVNELKTRIQSRIEVKKTHKGSQLLM